MDATLERQFLDHSAKKLRQYTERIESCLDKLNGEQVWARGGESENAVGNLVLHLCGNVRQWIVSGVGGQPDGRERAIEFSTRGGISVPQLVKALRETTEEALEALAGVSHSRLSEHLVIQHYEVSVLEAIYHVVEHFSMHTGQIMLLTKMHTGTDLGFYAHLNVPDPHSQKTP